MIVYVDGKNVSTLVEGILKRELAVFDYTKDLDWSFLILVVREKNISNIYTYSMSIHLRKRITRKSLVSLILQDSDALFFDEVDIDQNLWKEKDIKAIWNKISASFIGPDLGFRYPRHSYIID